MTWIKICGTTNLDDAKAAAAAGANAVGFIFAQSPRRIDPATAASIIKALPAEIGKIGVFVNESPSRIARLAGQVGLTGVQLQGDEPVDQLEDFVSMLDSRMLIKTLQAGELLAATPSKLNSYVGAATSVDAFLVDSGSLIRRGGTGARFDWKAALPFVSQLKDVSPVVIAGGLTPENVADAIRLLDPWGVDVVSGVEREPGKKDEKNLRAFVEAVRNANSPSPTLEPPDQKRAGESSTTQQRVAKRK